MLSKNRSSEIKFRRGRVSMICLFFVSDAIDDVERLTRILQSLYSTFCYSCTSLYCEDELVVTEMFSGKNKSTAILMWAKQLGENLTKTTLKERFRIISPGLDLLKPHSQWTNVQKRTATDILRNKIVIIIAPQ